VILASAGIAGWAVFSDRGSDGAAAPAPTRSALQTPEATPEVDPTQPEAAPEPGDPDAVTNLATDAVAVAPKPGRSSTDSDGDVITYVAANLLDGDPQTCWRMSGDGSGQTIDLRLDDPATVTAVGLINGYAKTDAGDGTDRYLQERRILNVTWTFGDGTVLKQTLQDYTRTVQTIELPTPVTTDSVSLSVDSTTSPGDADYDKTAISEIQVLGS
jgi:hypothetical protein